MEIKMYFKKESKENWSLSTKNAVVFLTIMIVLEFLVIHFGYITYIKKILILGVKNVPNSLLWTLNGISTINYIIISGVLIFGTLIFKPLKPFKRNGLIFFFFFSFAILIITSPIIGLVFFILGNNQTLLLFSTTLFFEFIVIPFMVFALGLAREFHFI